MILVRSEPLSWPAAELISPAWVELVGRSQATRLPNKPATSLRLAHVSAQIVGFVMANDDTMHWRGDFRCHSGNGSP